MYTDRNMRDLRRANRARGARFLEDIANMLVEARFQQLPAFGLMVCAFSRTVDDGEKDTHGDSDTKMHHLYL